ncbi:MAG: universal stress protein [Rhodobacteraceae bacterium]|jgi:nucleotide-binding universal stress UspA family protein|nr:universal stress protein [Paracoccaceae bacterium]
MSFKTITTVLTGGATDHGALDAALSLASREGAHLTVVALGIDRSMPAHYYAGAHAVMIETNFAEAQAEAANLAAAAETRLAAWDVPFTVEPMTAQIATIAPYIGQAVRFSDLVVLGKPYGKEHGPEAEAVVEAALFGAGVPVLVVPGTALPERFGRVVVAWNESDAALRAVRAALPVLKMAQLADIVVIDPPVHGPERSDPGGELSQMLARHGVRAEVNVLARTMPRVSDILMRHARDKAADLIVMGAYGHSRFREAIFGGATRHMLEEADLPVLMKH